MNTKTILIAEDHPIVVKGLQYIIKSLSPEFEFLVADTCQSYMNLLHQSQAHYCIVDLNLLDGFSFASIENTLNLYPETNLFVYSSLPAEVYAKRLFNIGIHGFINKKASESELILGLTKFLNDDFYISPELIPLIVRSSSSFSSTQINPFELLSSQELILVEYLKEGESIKSISEKMSIMSNTAATYKKRAFQKLEIENIIQLDRLYQTYGDRNV
jgi:DNA-binding NarL/FixJ family response regulator